jgi:hypothetical protein
MQLIVPGTDAAFREAKTGGFSGAPDTSQRPSYTGLSKETPIHLNRAQLQRARAITASADITRVGPAFVDPRYSSSTLQVPTDVRQLNGLYRFFDQTDPVIGTSHRLHTEIPLSDVLLTDCGDEGVQQHFEEMWDRIQGSMLLMDIGHEFWSLGNVFCFGNWNASDYMWQQFAILNPDFVDVQSTWINEKPLIKLIPDDPLKKIIQTRSPEFIYNQIPREIIEYVQYGQPIPLDPNNVFHIAHCRAPYETLGYPPQKRLLKLLIYESRLTEAQFAIATRHVVPVTIVKVGDAASGWIPSGPELDEVRELFASYEMDPNFCYDKETECLTASGWKKYTELTYQDKIASFNPDGNRLEYYHPSLITVQDYDGEMYSFKTRNMDVCVTPNHRMWLCRNNQWQVIHAEETKVGDYFRTTVDKVEEGYSWPEDLPQTRGTLEKDFPIVTDQAIEKVSYKDKIWCVSVPTGIIVTRRNGHVINLGQTIIWHYGINIEFYGATGKILPLYPEFERIQKLKFIGMGISDALMTGSAGTYASAFVSLEILRQRYLNFQLKLQLFIDDLFRAVSQMCGFYKTTDVTAGASYRGKKYGSIQDKLANYLSSFTGLRDYKDNEEFQRMVIAKRVEGAINDGHFEYVHPTLTFGTMSAASDMNYRQWLLALKDKNPFAVSWSTIGKASRLDSDLEQNKSIKEFRELQKTSDKLRQEGIVLSQLGGEGLGGGMVGPDLGAGIGPAGIGGIVPGELAPPSAPMGAGEFAGAETVPAMAGVDFDLEKFSEVLPNIVEKESRLLAAQNRTLTKKLRRKVS